MGMKMTFKQLAEAILVLTPEQQAMDATVSLDLSQEATAVTGLTVVQNEDMLDGVLDVGHPVITVDF